MTIYDIARETGVSASTVSRVLNKKKGVNPATRKQIETLLQQYHFEPNASAQGLVSQSSKIIGIMVSDIRTAHHAEGAYYIEQELQKVGYSCIIVNGGFTDEKRENCMRLLSSRRAEAIVLIGSTFQKDSIKEYIQKYASDLPIIIENGIIDLPNVYSVMTNEKDGICDCVDLLFRKGRRRPCFVNMDETPSNDLKIKGFLNGCRANIQDGWEAPIVQIPRCGTSSEWDACYETVSNLLTAHPEFDSLVFATDLLANAGVRALLDAGISVPEQVAVIGVDNSMYATLSRPQITSLDNKLQELSMTCSNILVDILSDRHCPRRLMLLPEIVERETT